MATGGYILSYATTRQGPRPGPHPGAAGRHGIRRDVVRLYPGIRLPLRPHRSQKTYLIGYACLIVTVFPLFWLVNTGNLWAALPRPRTFHGGLGLAYGPQAALYSELFPASIRFSGVSISYALGAILGGASRRPSPWRWCRPPEPPCPVSAYLLLVTTFSTGALCWSSVTGRASTSASRTGRAGSRSHSVF